MFTPRILRGRPLNLREMRIDVSSEEWAAAVEYDALAEPAWQQMRAERPVWDGTYYRVIDPAALEWDGPLHLGTIRYRYIATFPVLHLHYARCGLEPLHHLSTIALLRTCDGQYLFGRRAANGAVELIGGGVQPDELAVAGGADLEENLYKEIREETGIERGHIGELRGLGAVLSSTSNVLLVAHAQLRISRAEAAEAFAGRSEPEMAELIAVPETGLRAFLGGLADYRSLIPGLL